MYGGGGGATSGPKVLLRRRVRGGLDLTKTGTGAQDFVDMETSLELVLAKLEGVSVERREGVLGEGRRLYWGGERWVDWSKCASIGAVNA